MRNKIWVVGLVGVCGSGKTTLTKALKPYPFHVRQIAQEHSYVPDMWERITRPDILFYLDVSYPQTIIRRKLNWTFKEYQVQISRLKHAHDHSDVFIRTDTLSPHEVLTIALKYIQSSGIVELSIM